MRKTMMFSVVAAMAIASMLYLTTADAGEKKESAGVEVGQQAPDFTLQNSAGEEVSLSDYEGKIVVLEWFNNECPFVVKFYQEGHMQGWANAYAEQEVVWLAINSTHKHDNEHNAGVREDWNMNHAILNDSKGKVGKMYGATNTPHMFVINAEGNIAYMGAIDSKKSTKTSDIEGATNYVAAALDALIAGEEIETQQTQAYGCSVKYAK